MSRGRKKGILLIIFILIVSGIMIFWYYGFFQKVSFREVDAGGEKLVYQEILGDYKKSGVAIDQVYRSLKDDFGVECTLGFGIYYDNPQETPADKLRSDVGCVLPEEASFKIDQVANKFKVKRQPVVKSIITEFPYRDHNSFLFGVLKVYPRLAAYQKDNGYGQAPVMEIYDLAGGKTIYRTAIVSQVLK